MVFLPRSSCSWLLKGITPPRRPCRGPEWPGRGQHPRLGSTPCSLGPWASGTPSCCLIGEQERPECTPLRGCGETRSGPAGPPAQYRSVPPGRRPGPASAFRCLPSGDRLPSSPARGPNQVWGSVHPRPPSSSTPTLGHLGGCGMGLGAWLQGLHTLARRRQKCDLWESALPFSGLVTLTSQPQFHYLKNGRKPQDPLSRACHRSARP